MSAPGSRLARQMRSHLWAGGHAELWDEFVEHANRHYKSAGCARLCPNRACCAAWAPSTARRVHLRWKGGI